jgi:hypothetical protein
VFELPVKVEITKLNPNYSVVFEKDMKLEYIWHELTALQFRVDERGNVVDKSEDFISIRPNTVDGPLR